MANYPRMDYMILFYNQDEEENPPELKIGNMRLDHLHGFSINTINRFQKFGFTGYTSCRELLIGHIRQHTSNELAIIRQFEIPYRCRIRIKVNREPFPDADHFVLQIKRILRYDQNIRYYMVTPLEDAYQVDFNVDFFNAGSISLFLLFLNHAPLDLIGDKNKADVIDEMITRYGELLSKGSNFSDIVFSAWALTFLSDDDIPLWSRLSLDNDTYSGIASFMADMAIRNYREKFLKFLKAKSIPPENVAVPNQFNSYFMTWFNVQEFANWQSEKLNIGW